MPPELHRELMAAEWFDDNSNKKPPLGVTPKYIWDSQRLNEIKRAMTDYIQADFKIPVEWVEEYNELLNGG